MIALNDLRWRNCPSRIPPMVGYMIRCQIRWCAFCRHPVGRLEEVSGNQLVIHTAQERYRVYGEWTADCVLRVASEVRSRRANTTSCRRSAWFLRQRRRLYTRHTGYDILARDSRKGPIDELPRSYAERPSRPEVTCFSGRDGPLRRIARLSLHVESRTGESTNQKPHGEEETGATEASYVPCRMILSVRIQRHDRVRKVADVCKAAYEGRGFPA